MLRGDPAARTSPGCSGRRAPDAKSQQKTPRLDTTRCSPDFAPGALRPLHPGDVRAAGSPRSKPQISRTSPGCSGCMFPSQRRPGPNRRGGLGGRTLPGRGPSGSGSGPDSQKRAAQPTDQTSQRRFLKVDVPSCSCSPVATQTRYPALCVRMSVSDGPIVNVRA